MREIELSILLLSHFCQFPDHSARLQVLQSIYVKLVLLLLEHCSLNDSFLGGVVMIDLLKHFIVLYAILLLHDKDFVDEVKSQVGLLLSTHIILVQAVDILKYEWSFL